MTIVNLIKQDNPAFPILATFLRAGKEKSYGVRDKVHLIKRMGEIDRTETMPSAEEIEVMIANFPGIFEQPKKIRGMSCFLRVEDWEAQFKK